MNTVEISIKGTSPLLMHNGQLANPLNKYAKELKRLNKDKRRKGSDTDKVLEKMADVEWEGGLYYRTGVGPVVPAVMMMACIVEGAKLSRGGRSVGRGVTVGPHYIPLKYKGPTDIESLRADEAFRHYAIVRVGTARTVRVRPCFEEWALTFTATHSDRVVSRDDLVSYIRDAGLYEGLGDGRGKLGMGRFEIVSVK